MILKIQRKFIQTLFGALLLCSSFCGYAATANKPKAKPLEDQIAAFIPYPPTLSLTKASVIAVSLLLDRNGKITELESHSGIKELDTYIIRSLRGKNSRCQA